MDLTTLPPALSTFRFPKMVLLQSVSNVIGAHLEYMRENLSPTREKYEKDESTCEDWEATKLVLFINTALEMFVLSLCGKFST